MALSILQKPNTIGADATWPYGRIKDNPGDNTGTPVNQQVYQDFHQFFSKLMADAGLAFNGLQDNQTNGFQLNQALATVIQSYTVGLLDFKGNIDASANPNYPAASKGDCYIISVAGKVGGASGKVVDAGDFLIASADNAGGTEASVGTSWFVVEHNIGQATASVAGFMKLYSDLSASNTDGAPSQSAVNTGLALKAAIAQAAFSSPGGAIQNSWVGTNVKYRVDTLGMCHLTGVVTAASATGTTIYNAGAFPNPRVQCSFACPNGQGSEPRTSKVTITSTGGLTVDQYRGADGVDFEGIHYWTV